MQKDAFSEPCCLLHLIRKQNIRAMLQNNAICTVHLCIQGSALLTAAVALSFRCFSLNDDLYCDLGIFMVGKP